MSRPPFDNALYLPGKEMNIGIILFHAYTGTTRDVNLLARKLNRQGYTILVPLFSGHDTNDIKNVLKYSPKIWQEEAHAAYHWMVEQDFDHLLLFGLSMGGVLATDIMAEPDFSGSGGGVFNSPIVTEQLTDISDSFMNLGGLLAKLRKESEQFQAEYSDILKGHWKQMEELETIKKSIEERLVNIKTPFYIAQSGEDELINPEDAYLLQNHLVNARIDFHYFPDNTHTIPTNRDRDEFDQSVLDFVQQVCHPY